MNDKKIVLVARLKVKNDRVADAERAALALVDASRAESGCVNYDIHQAVDDETVFVWHETWTDKTALDEHFEKPYFKEFFAVVQEIAAEPPLIMRTKMISQKA